MHSRVRIVAIGSFLLFSVCLFYCVYAEAIHRPVRDALVDQWLDITFERRRLAGLNSTGVLLTPEDYENDLANLSIREQRIVFDNEFPADESELRAFLLSRSTGSDHSTGFWLLLVGSGTAFAAAVSWLRGYSARDFSEKAEATAVSGEA
jgi:hypothetical protein